MIFLDVFLMLSIILDSLLLQEVWREGFIENDITDILLIGQYGFDGLLRPGSFSSGSQNAVSLSKEYSCSFSKQTGTFTFFSSRTIVRTSTVFLANRLMDLVYTRVTFPALQSSRSRIKFLRLSDVLPD